MRHLANSTAKLLLFYEIRKFLTKKLFFFGKMDHFLCEMSETFGNFLV